MYTTFCLPYRRDKLQIKIVYYPSLKELIVLHRTLYYTAVDLDYSLCVLANICLSCSTTTPSSKSATAAAVFLFRLFSTKVHFPLMQCIGHLFSAKVKYTLTVWKPTSPYGVRNRLVPKWMTMTLFRDHIKVTPTVALHLTLNIPETARDRGLVPKDYQ